MNNTKRTLIISCVLFSLVLIGFGTIYQVFYNTTASATVLEDAPKEESTLTTPSSTVGSTNANETTSTKSLYHIYVTSKWTRMKHSGSANYLASQYIAQNTEGGIINKYSASMQGTTKVVTSLKTGPGASYCNVVQLPSGKLLDLLGDITNPAGEKWLMYKYAYAVFYVAANDIEVIAPPPATPTLTATKTPTKSTAPVTPTPPTVPASENGQKIISLAYSKLGYAYVYGAEGPNSFDCSGFVYWVVNNSGIPGLSVPRTSIALYNQYQAYNIGTSIANAHPGDIILFSTNGTVNGITHSSIYYKDSMMIHASTPSTGVILTTVAYSTSNKSVFAIIRLPGC